VEALYRVGKRSAAAKIVSTGQPDQRRAQPGQRPVLKRELIQKMWPCPILGAQHPQGFSHREDRIMSHTEVTAGGTVTVTATIMSDRRDCFGGFERRYRWHCPQTATGYLVQRIDRGQTIFGADGSSEVDERETYWEAWRLVAGVVMLPDMVTPIPAAAAHDTWAQVVSGSQRVGKHGSWAMTGTLYWLDDGAPQIQPFRLNNVPSAASMHATPDDPGITSPPLLVNVHNGNWDGRTGATVCELLRTFSADETMSAQDREEAIGEMREMGFTTDAAAHGVDLYIQGGGTFTTEVSSDGEGTDNDQ